MVAPIRVSLDPAEGKCETMELSVLPLPTPPSPTESGGGLFGEGGCSLNGSEREAGCLLALENLSVEPAWGGEWQGCEEEAKPACSFPSQFGWWCWRGDEDRVPALSWWKTVLATPCSPARMSTRARGGSLPALGNNSPLFCKVRHLSPFPTLAWLGGKAVG